MSIKLVAIKDLEKAPVLNALQNYFFLIYLMLTSITPTYCTSRLKPPLHLYVVRGFNMALNGDLRPAFSRAELILLK